jgi:choline dehydrogenase-like flavoprotein
MSQQSDQSSLGPNGRVAVYDYVIVGAGSAGCVLAARLGEDSDVRVLVIEAGPPDTEPLIHVPLGFRRLWDSRFDWGLWSEPEPGLHDRRDYLPRGRVLGGSSSLNTMIYIRGNTADYDEWAAMGLPGWGYEDVLPYFRRAEDNERGESYYHGIGGPLTVSEGRSMHPLVRACIDAAADVGIAPTDDHNGHAQEGAGWFQLTQRNGRRCSTAVAYLHPARVRGNVTALTDALTTRVLFEGDRAVGVELLRNNNLETVRAEREVIVCAGAYHSPQLLLLSGIGSADELRDVGIEPRVDLPVGHNLHDHLGVSLAWLTDQPSIRRGTIGPESVALFEREGRGVLTSGFAEGGAFVRTQAGLKAPDIQFHFCAGAVAREVADPPAVDDGFTIQPTLLKPTSRGRVTLRDSLPHVKPRITHNYLTTKEDARSMIEGTRIGLEIAARSPLRKLSRADMAKPRSESDADVLEFVRHAGRTIFHPVGTCAMGTVLDAELRVLGVEGLRVADASVMPTIVRGNTNAPTIMIAEKAADLIRGLPPLPQVADKQGRRTLVAEP